MAQKETPQKQTNVQTGDCMRAFIALCLPKDVISALADLQGRLRGFGIKMKYTDPQNIHLTLKFLGQVPVSEISVVSAALEDAAADFSKMELSARGLGVFPGVRRPRVMWTGISGHTDQLQSMHLAVERRMADLGFAKEDRRFTGHLTLGRFKAKADPVRIADAIAKFGDFAAGPFDAASVELFESTLTPKGPVYRVVSSHRLICGKPV
jgi:2'-5' RNA ligase